MIKTGIFILLAVLLIPSPGVISSNELSFQGYTGLLNIPNGYVTPNKRLEILFSNQLEYTRKNLDRAENYVFSTGLLPNFEIGGRFTEERLLGHHAPHGDLEQGSHLALGARPAFVLVAVGEQSE